MNLHVDHSDFRARPLAVRPAGFFRGPKLLQGEAEIRGKRLRFKVRDDSNRERAVRIKPKLFDPVPSVEIDTRVISLARPLTWYEYGWMGLPVLLVFAGGGLGALIGLTATYASSRIFRSDGPRLPKYLLSGLISITAFLAFFVAALAVDLLIAP